MGLTVAVIRIKHVADRRKNQKKLTVRRKKLTAKIHLNE